MTVRRIHWQVIEAYRRHFQIRFVMHVSGHWLPHDQLWPAELY